MRSDFITLDFLIVPISKVIIRHSARTRGESTSWIITNIKQHPLIKPFWKKRGYILNSLNCMRRASVCEPSAWKWSSDHLRLPFHPTSGHPLQEFQAQESIFIIWKQSCWREDKKRGFVGFNQQAEEHPVIYGYTFWFNRCFSPPPQDIILNWIISKLIPLTEAPQQF